MKRAVLVLAVVVINILSPAWIHAQAAGQINGIVTDSSGSVLPGVTVEATNTATGAMRSAISGADGLYSIPLLAPGSYTVKASLQGFRTAQRDGVRVTVTETARAAFELEVGQLTETITVNAEVTLVETSNATHGIVIDEQKVVDLPLNGRNFTQLGTLIPGVVAPPGGLGGQTGDATPGGFGNATGGFNVNGMRNQSNNFLMDGATNNDTFNTGFVLRPPPDAIQEFKILTHAFSAEYGRNAGSVVNVVTKSGSNTLSGAVWEFNRNDALNARNYFAPQTQPKPELKQNQFGAAFGGPLMRNRLFGFGYYEGYRNDSGITQNILVLSAAQRAGDFSGGAAIRDPLTGQPFAGNIIPAARISPVATQAAQRLRAAAELGRQSLHRVADGVRLARSVRHPVRLPARRSPVDARTLHAQRRPIALTPRIIAPIDQRALATLQDGLVSHNFVISSRLVNQARFSINRISANPAVTSGLSPRIYGINFANTNPLAAGLPSIARQRFLRRRQCGARRCAAAIRRSRQPRLAGRRRSDVDHGPPFDEVRRRYPPRGDADRVHQSSERRPDLQRRPHRQRRGRLPARPARAGARHDAAGDPGWLRLAVRRLRAGRVPRHLAADVEPRRALRAADAVHRPERRDHRLPHRCAIADVPGRSCRPGLSGRSGRAARRRADRQEQHRAARWRSRGIPKGDGRTSVRSAFGVFYDALAGQGDFFQSGVLSPPFTPLIELNTPTPITIADPLAAVAGPPNPFPAALTIIGWGDDFKSPYAYHFNARRAAAAVRAMSAPRSPTSDRAATTCRSSWRSIPACMHRDRPRAARA